MAKVRTFKRRFVGKQFLKLVDISRDCPLSYEQRVLYSWLVRAAGDGAGYRPATLAYDSGMDEGKTIPRCREALLSMGLVRITDGIIHAVEPDEEKRGWFRFFDRKKDEPVWKLFKYVSVPVRTVDSPLTSRQAAILGILYSFAQYRNDVKGLTVSGVATLLGASRQTVHDGLMKLVEHGLLEVYPSRSDKNRFAMILPKLTPDQLAWFRDTSEVQRQSDEDYPGFAPLPDENEEDFEESPKSDKAVFIEQARMDTIERGGRVTDEEYSLKYDCGYDFQDDDSERDSTRLFKVMMKMGFEEREARTCYGIAVQIDMTKEDFETLLNDSYRKYDRDRYPSCFYWFRSKLAKKLATYERFHSEDGKNVSDTEGRDGHRDSGRHSAEGVPGVDADRSTSADVYPPKAQVGRDRGAAAEPRALTEQEKFWRALNDPDYVYVPRCEGEDEEDE